MTIVPSFGIIVIGYIRIEPLSPYQAKGLLEESAASFKKSLSIQPNDEKALDRCGIVLQHMGRYPCPAICILSPHPKQFSQKQKGASKSENGWEIREPS